MCRVQIAQQMAHISDSLSVHQHMIGSLDHKTHIGLLKWIHFMHIEDIYLQLYWNHLYTLDMSHDLYNSHMIHGKIRKHFSSLQISSQDMKYSVLPY